MLVELRRTHEPERSPRAARSVQAIERHRLDDPRLPAAQRAQRPRRRTADVKVHRHRACDAARRESGTAFGLTSTALAAH